MSDPSEAARQLAALRPRATYVCAVCGREFEAVARTGRETPRTCSQRCRAKAWQARIKQQSPA